MSRAQEIYSVDELISAFSLERVTKSPAVFDLAKLRWINGQHLRALPRDEITSLVGEHLADSGVATCHSSYLPHPPLSSPRVTLAVSTWRDIAAESAAIPPAGAATLHHHWGEQCVPEPRPSKSVRTAQARNSRDIAGI